MGGLKMEKRLYVVKVRSKDEHAAQIISLSILYWCADMTKDNIFVLNLT